MKNRLISLICEGLMFACVVVLFCGCSHNKEDEPEDPNELIGFEWIDPTFAKALEEKGYIMDAETVRPSDVKDITYIDVSSTYLDNRGPIVSLRGIEYFTSIETLNIRYNKIREIDLSENKNLSVLECAGNFLTQLSLRSNRELRLLGCDQNQLSVLDISQNEKITNINCNENELKTLDISHNPNLLELSCALNKLTELNVSNLTSIYYLWCSQNSISNLDLSKNKELKYLWCFDNNIETLDLSHNLYLEKLVCRHNKLLSLNIVNNLSLSALSLDNNPGKDGKFIVSAWFDNNNIPEGFTSQSWSNVTLLYINDMSSK